jgi:hypothetical protein
MADKILHKRNLTGSILPTTASLDVGELAINVADGKVHLRKSGSNEDVIVSLVTANTVTTGSIQVTNGFTGSLFGNATSASFVTGSNVYGPFGSNSIVSSSFAISSSRAVTSSFAISASWAPTQTIDTSSLATSGSNIFRGNQVITGSLTATQGITSSLFGTASWAINAITASYALNGGVTQLLAGPNVTLSPSNGLGQVTISSTSGGGGGFNTATGSYGSFYSTSTQINPVANIPRSMSLNITDITNGVSISGSTNPFNTYIKTENAGVYDIQFSTQLDKTDSGNDEIVIWLRKNGINLTDTATTITLIGNNGKQVAAWNWFVNSAANDYYQIIWQSADTNVRLLAELADGHPGIPSVIVTVNRVDQFLSNTGSFSGSFTGNLIGTASFALSATSASYAATASVLAGGVPSSFPFTGSAIISGSLIVTGGLNVSSNVNINGALNSFTQSATTGGKIFLTGSSIGTTITGGVVIDVSQNRLRFYEEQGSNRGYFLDMTSGSLSIGFDLATPRLVLLREIRIVTASSSVALPSYVTEISGAQTTCSFSGLNGNSDLMYIIKGTLIGTQDDSIGIRINNLSTSIYNSRRGYWGVASATSFNSQNMLFVGNQAPAAGGAYTPIEINFLEARTGFKRTVGWQSGQSNSSDQIVQAQGGYGILNDSTTNITSISFHHFSVSNNYAPGTVIRLYTIK